VLNDLLILHLVFFVKVKHCVKNNICLFFICDTANGLKYNDKDFWPYVSVTFIGSMVARNYLCFVCACVYCFSEDMITMEAVMILILLSNIMRHFFTGNGFTDQSVGKKRNRQQFYNSLELVEVREGTVEHCLLSQMPTALM